jgi:multiple sugar transport system substrate-binding protein
MDHPSLRPRLRGRAEYSPQRRIRVKKVQSGRKISNRARVMAAPAAAAAFAVPTIIKRSASAQDQTTVRLSGWSASPEENELLTQVIETFMEQNPAISVDYQLVTGDYAAKLQTDIAAGTVADVFYVDSLMAPDLMSRAVLLPFDDFMAASDQTADQYYPGLIEAFQFQGVTYGLPKDWSSLAMVYNQQALTDAGISAAPTTWEELTAAAQTLKDSTGEPRVMIPPDFARYLAFHYAAGAEVISEDGTEIVIDSPEGQEALDFYYGLYRDELAITPADAGAEWPGDGLAKGLSDIVFEGNWVFPFLQTNAPDLDFGISVMPTGPGGQATLGFTVSYSIFGQTEVADAAWEVVRYLTGPDGMGQWTSLGLAMPSRPDLEATWLEQFPERQPFLDEGAYARGWGFGPGGQQFYGDAGAILEGLFAGEEDVAQALADLQAAAEANIQLGGTPSPEASPSPMASPSPSPTM